MKECPTGWAQKGNTCFFAEKIHKSWEEAYIYCQEKGGNLASIKDQSENDFVAGKLTSQQDKILLDIFITRDYTCVSRQNSVLLYIMLRRQSVTQYIALK